jgi:hypothetical protein
VIQCMTFSILPFHFPKFQLSHLVPLSFLTSSILILRFLKFWNYNTWQHIIAQQCHCKLW